MPQLRPYADSDAAQVAALLEAVPELPSTSEASFRQFAALSFNRDARDFRVLQADGMLIALLTSTLLEEAATPLRHFRITVHPAHQRLGLGTRLFEALRAQEAPVGTILQCNSQQSWASSNAFLERFGFRVARRELLMQRSTQACAVQAPPKIRIRSATEKDSAAWIELHAHGYGHRDDFSPLTPDDLKSERQSPGFDLSLAVHGEEIVGLCHALDSEPGKGLINSLVVRSDMRGQGLGAALLASVVTKMSARGTRQAELNVVSDNRPAIRVYERLGFSLHDEMLTYQRPS